MVKHVKVWLSSLSTRREANMATWGTPYCMQIMSINIHYTTFGKKLRAVSKKVILYTLNTKR